MYIQISRIIYTALAKRIATRNTLDSLYAAAKNAVLFNRQNSILRAGRIKPALRAEQISQHRRYEFLIKMYNSNQQFFHNYLNGFIRILQYSKLLGRLQKVLYKQFKGCLCGFEAGNYHDVRPLRKPALICQKYLAKPSLGSVSDVCLANLSADGYPYPPTASVCGIMPCVKHKRGTSAGLFLIQPPEIRILF